ncbi:hypothetical protein V7S43_018640 [Phytophthora oleae]|uniref:Tubulin/FtsZ GTPase domain-containing protein n=1 Tax=Phytophthora oleae TaxID=2107226 RepID=A0ABD3EQ08_9STRA
MLTLQVGQCGNQLGRALFDKLAVEESADISRDSAFFRSPGDFSNDRSVVNTSNARRARAVLIDMEPKVIQQCYRPTQSGEVLAAGAWEYGPKSTFTRQSGSGNNWASGYKAQGTQEESELLDLLQSVCACICCIIGLFVLAFHYFSQLIVLFVGSATRKRSAVTS